jgi:hypothetical protein
MTNKELMDLQDTPEGRKVLGEYLAELTVPIKQLKSHTSRCPKCGTSNIDRLRALLLDAMPFTRFTVRTS